MLRSATRGIRICRVRARVSGPALEKPLDPEQSCLKGKWCFFFVVAPPGLFRPDVVHQTFFAIA